MNSIFNELVCSAKKGNSKATFRFTRWHLISINERNGLSCCPKDSVGEALEACWTKASVNWIHPSSASGWHLVLQCDVSFQMMIVMVRHSNHEFLKRHFITHRESFIRFTLNNVTSWFTCWLLCWTACRQENLFFSILFCLFSKGVLRTKKVTEWGYVKKDPRKWPHPPFGHLLLKEKGNGCSLFSPFSGWFPDVAFALLWLQR